MCENTVIESPYQQYWTNLRTSTKFHPLIFDLLDTKENQKQYADNVRKYCKINCLDDEKALLKYLTNTKKYNSILFRKMNVNIKKNSLQLIKIAKNIRAPKYSIVHNMTNRQIFGYIDQWFKDEFEDWGILSPWICHIIDDNMQSIIQYKVLILVVDRLTFGITIR
jgi:hypothetical protein